MLHSLLTLWNGRPGKISGFLLLSLLCMSQVRLGAVCTVNSRFAVRDSAGVFIFTDSSSGANRYMWNFGDGTYSYSSGTQYHTYPKTSSRYYYARLKVWDTTQVNCFDTFFTTLFVRGCNAYTNYGMSTFGYQATFTNFYAGLISKWDFGDGNTSTVRSPVHTYSSVGTYNVKLVVEDTASGCKDSLTKSVVITGCMVRAGFTEKDSGGVHYFTNTTTGGANRFYWDFGDGNTSTAENPAHAYSKDGFYYVRFHAWDTSLNGCEDTMYRPVKVGCLASAYFSYYRGGNTIYFSQYNSYGIVYKYYWDFGNGQTSNAAYPVITYSSPGMYSVRLLVVDSINPGCRDSLTVNVNVNVCNTKASFVYTTSGKTVHFINTSTNANDYYWNFTGPFYVTLKDPYFTFPNYGTYPIQLVVYDSSTQCGDTLNTNITISACNAYTLFGYSKKGLQVSFTNSSGGSNLKYYWNFGDGQTSNARTPVHTYSSTGTYNVKLRVWDSTNFGCRDSNNAMVDVMCGVGAGAWYRDSIKQTWFINYSVNANKYLWNLGDGTYSTLHSPTHVYSGPARNIGVYLIVWDTNYVNCRDSLYFTIWYSGCSSYYTIEPDTSNQFSALVVNRSRAGSGATFKWYFGDGDSSTARTPSHTYSGTGPFQLCLVVNDSGCSSMFCDTLGFDSSGNILAMRPFSIRVVEPGKYNTTAIDEAQLPQSRIYPNPTQGIVKIESAGLISQVRVSDVQGRMIHMTDVSAAQYTMDMRDWSPGIYIITIIYNGNQHERVKLIKN